MDGMEKIMEKLAAENKAECDAILNAAREKAASITARYAERGAAEKEALLRQGREEAESYEQRLLSAEKATRRRAQLAVKQELMEKVYDRALEKLCAQSAEEKTAQLTDMLLAAAPDGQGTVYVCAADKAVGEALVSAANAKVGGAFVLASEAADIPGGFILKRGAVSVNASYEKLLRSVWERSTAEVAKLLQF